MTLSSRNTHNQRLEAVSLPNTERREGLTWGGWEGVEMGCDDTESAKRSLKGGLFSRVLLCMSSNQLHVTCAIHKDIHEHTFQ